MEIIKVALYSKMCLSETEGRKLRDLIEGSLKVNDIVEVDFIDMGLFASPYFNTSFGYLFNLLGPIDYSNRIKVKNLTSVGEKTYNKVMENALNYYNSDKKNEIDEIINNTDK